MERYEIIGRLGEGAHGIVLEATEKQTKSHVALKKIAFKRLDDGIPVTVFRELKALQELKHHNIVRLREAFAHSAGLVLVFDFMLSDLSELIRDFENPLSLPQIKAYLQQMLYGLAHMHSMGIMHRDLKPANLLISDMGILKIADLGQARIFHRNSAQGKQSRPYSHQVCTRWYRAPELLYGARDYTQNVDMWSVGCIFGEMLNNSPVFAGENDIEQLVCVYRLLGSPTPADWPGMSDLPDFAKITFPKYPAVAMETIFPDAGRDAIQLVAKWLLFDSNKRLAAADALIEPFFMSRPLPAKDHELPPPKRRSQKHPQNIDFDPSIPIEQSIGVLH